jgi:hypothetical protein
MEKEADLALMYLFPWDLLEEVIRSPDLSPLDRLEKAFLSFYISLHYFNLSFLLCIDGVTQPFDKRRTVAEDSVWPRILNFNLVILHFILNARPDWSFARLGTHCLENFFGCVRQNARADDRTITALRIIARTMRACLTMQKWNIKIVHRGPDNVGDVVLGEAPILLSDAAENGALRLVHSFISKVGLDLGILTRPLFKRRDLQALLNMWRAAHQHHEHGQAYNTDFTESPCNARIAAHNRHTSF